MPRSPINPDDVTLHLIGNAHLDPVWLWRWQEGFAETKATFRSALDRMNETPGFVFTCAAAAIYEWIEQSDPKMFAEIRRRVRQGRWVVTGGWWIQPDCNIPSGESFVRHGLYSQRYFERALGRRARVGYCVDSFGHAATLPKLLAGCDLRGYVWMRPGRHENDDIPWPVFWWETPDGSRVLSMRIMTGYTAGSAAEALARFEEIPREHMRPPLTTASMCFYGVGNHGGGPTKAQLAAIEQWRKDRKRPKLVYSSPDAFHDVVVSQVGDKLPRYKGELQHHASGCYAAVSLIKALNRRAEETLLAAERWASIARMTLGRAAPTEALARAWKHVLFNQFHDIMAGTSVEEAYVDARDQMGAALHEAGFALNNAQQMVSWNVDTRGEGTPVFVFNNQAHPFEGVVETEDISYDLAGGKRTFTDNDGNPIPFQIVAQHTRTNKSRAVLHVDLPAIGHRLLRLREGKAPSSRKLLGKRAVRAGAKSPRTGPWRLENDRLRLEVDRKGLIQIRDKRAGRRVFSTPAGEALVMRDKSDTWSHDVFRFDKVIGRFKATSVRLIEEGPVRGGIRVKSRYGDSILTLDYLLGAGEGHVEVRGEIDWRDAWKVVKYALPVAVKADTCTVEIPYGTIKRPTDGEEEPMQQWVDVSDRRGGLAVANNNRYSHSAGGSEIRITLLRSPAYAFHDPFPIDYDGDHRITDRGPQPFRLLLIPHKGDWRNSDVIAKARQLNLPPNVLFETYHPGPLKPELTGAACDAPGVEVSVIKQAEDGRALVVRACEWLGRKTRAKLSLPPAKRRWQATFAPGQVKTFVVPDRRGAAVREVNMLEE
ncbi:MAG: alpha-mannosidase [Phycisphaerae bacterium]|nr:alpha-mannosidase [Phycisphaerae bacterium]